MAVLKPAQLLPLIPRGAKGIDFDDLSVAVNDAYPLADVIALHIAFTQLLTKCAIAETGGRVFAVAAPARPNDKDLRP